MRIVNKDKQVAGSEKRIATRRLRHSLIETEHVHGIPERHDQNACPVCGARIEKTASGGRRKRSCLVCGATLQKELVCGSCCTNRIWRGPRGAACLGCGAKFNL